MSLPIKDSDSKNLPAYNNQLEAYHRAFTAELKQIIADLPLKAGDRALDLACGDGFYTRLMAERVGGEGLVVGVDCLPDYLAVAKSRPDGHAGASGRMEYVAGDVEALPMARGTFDLVWCAQSLYSLPDPAAALARMREMARPGGVIAVLENDSLHDLLLPWPASVEMIVRNAEYAAHAQGEEDAEKFYVGRNLWAICQAAGLKPLRLKTYAFDRQAPLGAAEREFLASHLRRLLERVGTRLGLDEKAGGRENAGERENAGGGAKARTMIDPTSAESIMQCPHLTMTSLNTVLWGMREG